MSKEQRKEQKRINKQKKKAEFDELNHQKDLKYRKLKDVTASEKQNYLKKSQNLKNEYKNNYHQIKLTYASELKIKLIDLKNQRKNSSKFKKEIKQIKQENKTALDKKLSELKNTYKDNLFSLKTLMLYEIAKNQVTEKQQKFEKMKVDKRCAYNVYHKKMKFINNIYNEKVNEISNEHRTRIGDYRKKLSEFIFANKNNRKTNEYKQKLEQLHTQYIQINLECESKIIENKITYKNTCAQALHQRDLSYDNDLDTNFKLRRWWYGIGKEFQRMSWPTGRKTFKDFWVVIFVTAFLVGVFALLDYILTLF